MWSRAAPTGVLKPYHQAVVSAIRASDPDNIIVLGTPTWSQSVDQAAASPRVGFELDVHAALLLLLARRGRATGDKAIKAGLALFVTEWAASHADGGLDGKVCTAEAQAWINWMKSNGISWAAWKLDVGNDSTNLLSSGARRSPVDGTATCTATRRSSWVP